MLAAGVEGDEPWLVSFICADSDLRSELRFGRDCPAERRRLVAESFWGLLASDRCALDGYRERFYSTDDHDACPTLTGYRKGLFHLEFRRR